MEDAEEQKPVEAEAKTEAEVEEKVKDKVEVEVEATLSRKQAIARLKAVLLELEGGSLVLDGVSVAELGDTVDLELEYCAKRGKHELEIELKW